LREQLEGASEGVLMERVNRQQLEVGGKLSDAEANKPELVLNGCGWQFGDTHTLVTSRPLSLISAATSCRRTPSAVSSSRDADSLLLTKFRARTRSSTAENRPSRLSWSPSRMCSTDGGGSPWSLSHLGSEHHGVYRPERGNPSAGRERQCSLPAGPRSSSLPGEDGAAGIVAEHGRRASYVRNIEANPRVRVRIGRRWRTGTARLVPGDDPRERLHHIVSRRPIAGLNTATVRLMQTDLLSIPD
jgi:deazaflavin-dependent oxidoreductase (nitroreductase family)